MTRRSKRRRHAQFELLEPRQLLAADPIISEFLARNSGSLRDEYGESSDWIEIWNRGDEPADLQGWYLTDTNRNLTKWRFPAATVGPGERLIVFASGRGQPGEVTTDENLHTNFRLDGDGEFLALVQPDGQTFASRFAVFPAQQTDVSYGIEAAAIETPLVDAQSPARVLVPTGPVADWTMPAFDDQSWMGGSSGVPNSVGFEVLGAELPDGLVSHLGLDEEAGSTTALESVSGVDQPIAGTASFEKGQFAGALQFDGTTSIAFDAPPAGLTDGFSLLAWVKPEARNRTILSALSSDLKTGFWLGYNSDGPWLGIAAGAAMAEGGTGAWKNVNAPDTMLDLSQWYHVAVTFDPADPAEEVRLYVNGQRLTEQVRGADLPDGLMGDPHANRFQIGLHNAGSFPFVGSMDDVAIFDRPLSDVEINTYRRRGIVGGGPILTPLIATDLLDAMHGQNSSAHIRIPFDVPDPEQFDLLDLKIHANDGFVAYLNGTEIARQNAPADLTWNSSATATVSVFESLTPTHFDIRRHLPLLKPAGNVLAIHGLNATKEDSTFWIRPELVAARIQQRAAYFAEPTPGEANGPGSRGFVSDTTFSIERGFYTEPFEVQIDTATEGAEIRYTTDGSVPSLQNGLPYEGPIRIETTTTLRAAAFLDDHLSLGVNTSTYLFLQDVIRQPAAPAGFPTSWDRYRIGPTGRPVPADYEMNPAVVAQHADTILDDLQSIPSLSIVMDPDDLFGAEAGIYTHPFLEEAIRERPTSLEWIEADGMRGFTVDAGIRLFGGWSRHFWATPKKSFTLKFKRPYGPTKLQFPLFTENQVDSQIPPTAEFDTVLLRAVFSDAWPDAASPPQYLRDLNARYMQLAMGQLSSHGTWVHLYLNGLYWGIYNVSERPDASFLAAYAGGDREDYDAVKHAGLCGPGCASNNAFEVIDGGEPARQGFQAALNAARKDLSDPTNYAAFAELVDVENLIDYILLQHYIGNVDWPHKNWYANRKRNGGEGWKFYVWDSEYTLRGVTDSRLDASNPNTPAYLFAQARRSPEFRLQFADRVQKHLFQDGALQPEANIARYLALAQQIEGPIKAEAARWGDHGDTRKGPTNYTFASWTRIRDSIVERYFPRRHAIAIRQLRRAGLFPNFEAPSFSQFGGALAADQPLQITAPQGTIFYTLDGSDPKDAGIQYDGPITLQKTTVVKARVRHEDQWSALTAAAFTITAALPAGDFNADGVVDATDIGLFCPAFHTGTADDRFDLNGDRVLDARDRDRLIYDLLRSTYGDADLDGVFDSADLVKVFQAGHFEDRIEGNSRWHEGDWNCNGEFETGDLVLAFQSGRYVPLAVPQRAVAAALPLLPSANLASPAQDAGGDKRPARQVHHPKQVLGNPVASAPSAWDRASFFEDHQVTDLVFQRDREPDCWKWLLWLDDLELLEQPGPDLAK